MKNRTVENKKLILLIDNKILPTHWTIYWNNHIVAPEKTNNKNAPDKFKQFEAQPVETKVQMPVATTYTVGTRVMDCVTVSRRAVGDSRHRWASSDNILRNQIAMNNMLK